MYAGVPNSKSYPYAEWISHTRAGAFHNMHMKVGFIDARQRGAAGKSNFPALRLWLQKLKTTFCIGNRNLPTTRPVGWHYTCPLLRNGSSLFARAFWYSCLIPL